MLILFATQDWVQLFTQKDRHENETANKRTDR